MLRLTLLLLVLGNAGFFAWTRGLLAPFGLAPAVQSEPQRLKQQIRPETLRILTPPEAWPPEGPVPGTVSDASPSDLPPLTLTQALFPIPAILPAPAECLQAGLFNEEQTALLRTRLQSTLPAGGWVLESSAEPARWMVYMGKYLNAEAVTKKKGELRYLRVSFEAVKDAALEPGLSLGVYASQLEADNAMADIIKRGVRSAKVIQARPETRGHKLKLAAVDAVLRTRLDAIKPLLGGKALQACR